MQKIKSIYNISTHKIFVIKIKVIFCANVDNSKIAQSKNEGIKIEEYYDENVKIDLSGLRDNGISNVPLLDSTNSGMVRMLNSIIHCS